MGSSFGENIRMTIFGQSHSPAIGVVMEGLPPGFRPDLAALQRFLKRRAPGQSELTTQRKEADEPVFLSGLANGAFCGAPLCAVIYNADARPEDYAELSALPRPGHADFTAQMKFHGAQDGSGGGHFSGRLTAPLCIAGGLCLQLLEAAGVKVAAHIERIGDVSDKRFDPVNPEMERLVMEPLTVIDPEAGKNMAEAIAAARAERDSLGGVIECAVTGLPPGIGDPMFSGLENKISAALFAIPGVRGVEFGLGFEAARLRGSRHNDAFAFSEGKVVTKTNNHGGILGGLSSGMPLLFRAAVKPTPSIGKAQETVNLKTGEAAELSVRGRHDPCIVPRAVPCVEAAAALAVYDALLSAKKYS